MADITSAMAPDTVAMDAGRRREADLQQICDAMAAPNPHDDEIALPSALTDDGGY